MDNIEDRILNYGLLPAEEQQVVDQYVLGHPEFASMLDEVKALYALVDRSELQKTDRLQDMALAYYIAQTHFGATEAPTAEMTLAYNKLKHQIEHDEDVRTRYDAIKSRMAEIVNQSDPLAQFEKLSGHTIENIPLPAKGPVVGRGAVKEGGASTDNSVKEKAVDWVPVKRKQGITTRRWVTSASFLVLSSIAVFFIALHGNRLERMAYLDPEAFYANAPSGLRGTNPGWASADGVGDEMSGVRAAELNTLSGVRFKEGTDIVFGAQHSILNRFYTYDLDALSKAEVIFDSILQEQGLDAQLASEVKFALAKVYLAQRRTKEARDLLDDVAQFDGLWATEASQILDKL